MKKVFLLLLALGWLNVIGQTGPVFPYNHPLKQDLKSLALENSPKGYAFRNYMIEVINLNLKDTTLRFSEVDVSFIFENLFFEEVYLNDGGYYNSGYNSSSKKMVASLGHKWTGFVWVFRFGTFSFPLIKEDCGNILKAEVFRREVIKEVYFKKETPHSNETTEKRSVVEVVINNNQQPAQFQKVYIPPKKEIRIWEIVIPTAALVAVVAVILFKKTNVTTIVDNRDTGGRPGGSPTTPPVIPPVDEGNPGGSPITRVHSFF